MNDDQASVLSDLAADVTNRVEGLRWARRSLDEQTAGLTEAKAKLARALRALGLPAVDLADAERVEIVEEDGRRVLRVSGEVRQ